MLALPEIRRAGECVGPAFADPRWSRDAARGAGSGGPRRRAEIMAKALSYGDRRALEIGIALARGPRILFLDEPTSGLGGDGTQRWPSSSRGCKLALTHRHDRARHAFPVRARGPHLRHSLGTGHRRRHARHELRGEHGCSAPLSGRSPDARVDGIDTFYGETQALFDARCRSARERSSRCSAPTAPARRRRSARSWA